MGERVIVRQNSEFETVILAQDPHNSDDDHFYPVTDLGRLTPYGMLLAGLGSCTVIVLHTYAHYHEVALQEVELRLQYDRIFAQDCEQCEGIEEYKEQIEEEMAFAGELAPDERKRLFAVSRHCPIHKMLAQGIAIQSHLLEDLAAEGDAR